MKAYICNFGENQFGVYMGLVSENGFCLASHLCSHEGYAYGDLWGNRPERQEVFKEFNLDVDKTIYTEGTLPVKVLKKDDPLSDEQKAFQDKVNAIYEAKEKAAKA